MRSEVILKSAESAGVTIAVSSAGCLRVSGSQDRVNLLIPIIRDNKAALIKFLQQIPVELALKPCSLCNGTDFVHGEKGGYYCKICQPSARAGILVRAGRVASQLEKNKVR